MWGLFWALAALQAIDLLTTYEFLSTGKAREGNIFVKSVILTPIAPLLKAFALVFLATLVVRSLTYGRPAPRRLMIAMWVIFAAYVVVTLNNAYLILTPL